MLSNPLPSRFVLPCLLLAAFGGCSQRRPAQVNPGGSELLVGGGMPLAGTESMDVAVVLVSTNGGALRDQHVNLTAEGVGVNLAATEGNTDAEGMWRTKLSASSAGPVVLRAFTTDGDRRIDLGVPATVVFRTLVDPARCSFSADPLRITAGSTQGSAIGVVAKDALGTAIPNLRVTVESRTTTPVTILEGTTDSTGTMTTTFTTGSSGPQTVLATIEDHGQRVDLPTSLQIEVVRPVHPSVRGVTTYFDRNNNHLVDDGDEIVVGFDRPIRVEGTSAIDFRLPVTGDSLGVGATMTRTSDGGAVRIVLGAGAVLTVRGTHSAERLAMDAASGLDVAISTVSILDADTGAPARPGTAVDLVAGFTPGLETGAPAGVTSLAAGRLDPDSLRDLVLARPGETVSLRNTGNGSLGSPVRACDVGFDRGILLGDVDFDGVEDLVGLTAAGVFLAWGRADGTFVRGPRLDVAEPRGAALLDADRDGAVDILVAHDAGVTLWRSRGYGSGGLFDASTVATSGAVAIAVADLDRNGRSDLLVGGSTGVDVYLALGDGTFQPPSRISTTPCARLALGDVERNGTIDAMSLGDQGVALLRNEGRGQFAVVPVTSAAVAAIALIDADGDGDLDLALGAPTQPTEILLWNAAAGSFALSVPVEGAAGCTGLLAVDLDRDGDQDLVVASATGVKLWWNGTTTLRPDPMAYERVQVGTTEATSCLALGDLDGDGDLDIVAGNNRNDAQNPSESACVWLFEGGVHRRAQVLPEATGHCIAIALIDIDRDGDLDVVTTVFSTVNANQRRTDAWRNDGTGRFDNVSAAWLDDLRYGSALDQGDFDRDGRIDLVISTQHQGWASALHGRLSAPFLRRSEDSRIHGSLSYYVSRFAVGDLDGDGWPDVALTTFDDANPQPVRTALNRRGRRSFQEAVVTGSSVTSGWRSVAIVDVDGDGDRDLVQGPGPGQALFGIWHNNGAATFGDYRAFGQVATGTYVPRIVGADLDDDGDEDLVVAASAPDGVQIWRNEGGGTFAPARRLLSSYANDVVVADIDGDGRSDIAAAVPGAGISVWLRR